MPLIVIIAISIIFLLVVDHFLAPKIFRTLTDAEEKVENKLDEEYFKNQENENKNN